MDEHGAYRAEAGPVGEGVTGQFGSVVHSDVFGLAASGHDQFVEQSGGLIGVPRPTWPCRQRLAGELVDDVEETQLAAVDGEVVLVVQRPHVIGRAAAMRRCAALWPRRSRLRVFDGRCSRSSFHNRCVRLGLTTRPSDLAMACALRQPHRGWLMAISRSQARSRCSTPSGRCGPYCCTERCWPTTRQARRCETPNRSTSITTARRRRSGLTSFPGSSP